MKGAHKCIKESLRVNCPVCLEVCVCVCVCVESQIEHASERVFVYRESLCVCVEIQMEHAS